MVTETSAGGLTEPPWGGQGTIILILYLSQIQGSLYLKTVNCHPAPPPQNRVGWCRLEEQCSLAPSRTVPTSGKQTPSCLDLQTRDT